MLLQRCRKLRLHSLALSGKLLQQFPGLILGCLQHRPGKCFKLRQLRQHLERGLGGRESWDTPLLRQLFDALLQRARGRRRSAEHERVWLNLAGYCLRPGYGDALDPWRIEQLWALFDTGIQHHKDNQVCAEWWTLWRRVAGGLSTQQQLRLLDDFAFNLQADAAQRGSRPVTLVNGSDDDMLRLGASLERIHGAGGVGASAVRIARQSQIPLIDDAVRRRGG